MVGPTGDSDGDRATETELCQYLYFCTSKASKLSSYVSIFYQEIETDSPASKILTFLTFEGEQSIETTTGLGLYKQAVLTEVQRQK